jgi:hypothetical protein
LLAGDDDGAAPPGPFKLQGFLRHPDDSKSSPFQRAPARGASGQMHAQLAEGKDNSNRRWWDSRLDRNTVLKRIPPPTNHIQRGRCCQNRGFGTCVAWSPSDVFWGVVGVSILSVYPDGFPRRSRKYSPVHPLLVLWCSFFGGGGAG